MKKVFKFKLSVLRRQSILLPRNAEILCIQVQEEAPYLWARIDTNEQIFSGKTIYTYPTGEPMFLDAGSYLGSYQIGRSYEVGIAGPHVFHVFGSSSEEG